MKELKDGADNDYNNDNEIKEEQAKIAHEKVMFANELRAPMWTEIKEKKTGPS